MLINLTKKGVFLCRQKKKSYFCSVINLSRHIEYQLLYHDTIVVPQLGTFKATYVPSKWIKDEEILLPPYRALSFTQETDESDNRFVESISATYQISTEEAYIVTLEYTENIRQELAEYGSYELGSIGEFVLEEAAGKWRFIPCQAGVASPWLYGLDAIPVHPAVKTDLTDVRQESRHKSIHSDSKAITISINRRILHYATTVAASIVLFFAFSTPVSENSVSRILGSDSEFCIPASPVTPLPQTAQGEVRMDMPEATEQTEPQEETLPSQSAEAVKPGPTYSVVLCCGVPAQNAESYCQDLNNRGIRAIVDHSGKFLRVLIPGFTSREDALTEVRLLRSQSNEFSNAWIMERK